MTMMTEKNLTENLTALARCLLQQQLMMATAESCTGGWIAKAATDLEGSSSWFDRGLVTYSNRAKQEILNVPPEILESFGAVSQQTVAAMLDGLFTYSGIDLAVAVSGIAGPGGGTADKPVGTVWIGWQQRGQAATLKRFIFDGDRNQIRLQASVAAVQGLLAQVSK